MVKRIKMKAFGEPIVEHFATHDPKAAGFSLVQLIETSAITGHFVDDDGSAYLDIFSCMTFDIETATPDTVVEFLIWKDNFGKTKVHQEGCPFSGQKGNIHNQ